MENTVKIHVLGADEVLISGAELEDWKLPEFGGDDEVQVHIRPKSENASKIRISFRSEDEAEKASERRETAPDSAEEKTHRVVVKAQKMLEEAVSILGLLMIKDEDLPF